MTGPILGNPDDREPGRAVDLQALERRVVALERWITNLQRQVGRPVKPRHAQARLNAINKPTTQLAAASMSAVNFSAGVWTGKTVPPQRWYRRMFARVRRCWGSGDGVLLCFAIALIFIALGGLWVSSSLGGFHH